MELLGLILLVIFSAVTLLAALEAITLLFPDQITRVRQTLEASLARSFLLGLVNLIFFSAIILVLIWLTEQTGPVVSSLAAAGALLILVGLVGLLFIGLCALTSLVGQRMETGKPPLQAQRRGGLLLILVGLAPFIGWFLFTPLILSAGLGAAIQTMLQRRPKERISPDNA
ncbi:MAG: hypothetical protein JXA13_14240 [Anaerolineales bacterium]|nr:hypothetical protein [Anaerolineales bacterium]